MKPRTQQQRKVIVFTGGFILLVLLLFSISHPFQPKTVREEYYDKIEDSIDDHQSKESHAILLNAITNGVWGNTEARIDKLIISFIQKNPGEKIIHEAYRVDAAKTLTWIPELSTTAKEIMLFDNLKIQDQFFYYISQRNRGNAYSRISISDYSGIDQLTIDRFPQTIDSAKKYVLPNINDIAILESDYNFLSNSDMLSISTKEILHDYIELAKDTMKIKDEIDEAAKKWRISVEEQIEAHKKYKQILHLSGVIISKQNYNTYSIAIGSYTSNALLRTDITEFQSRGTFSVYAIREGNVPVTLKEEYGRFNQSWPLYVEVEPKEKQERKELLINAFNEVEIKKRHVYELQKLRNESKNKIISLRNKIVAAFSS